MGAAAEDLRVFQPSERARAIAAGKLTVDADTPGEVILYSHYASICSQRARLALVEKGIPFKSVMLHYQDGETYTPVYLGINPRGVVPTVIADGEVVFDSATIMCYLNNRYSGPDLMGENEDDTRSQIETADFFPIRDHVYSATLQREAVGSTHSGWGKETVEPFLQGLRRAKDNFPDFAENYELKIKDSEGQFARAIDDEVLARTQTYTDQIMNGLDDRLSVQNYISGNRFSLADVAWVPILIRLHYSLGKKQWGNGHRPNLERYFLDRIRNRPSFKTAITDHYYDNQVPDGLAV